MVRVLGKFGERIIQIINILATTVTVIAAVLNIFKFTKKSVFFYIIIVCGACLILNSAFQYVLWYKEHSRLQALRILAHRGRVNTINYMVYLDFLNQKFHYDYDNEPKTNSLVITRSEFTFHFFNGGEEKVIDVDYQHTFHVIKHGKKFDALILHAIGNLVRIPQVVDSEHNKSAYIKYQDNYYPIIPKPCIGDMRNHRNQVLDRVQCSLPAMNRREEILNFHYRVEKEFDTEDDDIFVIYPYNYGKKFNKEALFQLSFDEPYFADIQLLTLRYDYIINGPIQYVARFISEEGKIYKCKVDSLKERNIYMISIRHKVFME